MAADLTACDAKLRVAEEECCNEVGDAEDHGQDASCDNEATQRLAQVLLTGCGLVEIAQNVATQSEHCCCEEDESVLWTEQWPLAREVCLEQIEFGDD